MDSDGDDYYYSDEDMDSEGGEDESYGKSSAKTPGKRSSGDVESMHGASPSPAGKLVSPRTGDNEYLVWDALDLRRGQQR